MVAMINMIIAIKLPFTRDIVKAINEIMNAGKVR